MKSDKWMFANIAAVVVVSVPLMSAWAASGLGAPISVDSAALNAKGIAGASSMPSATGRQQDVSEPSPEAERAAEHEISNLRPLHEYLRDARIVPTVQAEGHGTDLLGMEVEDTVEQFEAEYVSGVEVVKVRPSSPAALAGLTSRESTVNAILATSTFAAALAFPPMWIGYMLVSDGGIGDRHDLIIGVDGKRVWTVDDLEDAIGLMKEGDVVYLSILRAGKRLQVPVSLETTGSK